MSDRFNNINEDFYDDDFFNDEEVTVSDKDSDDNDSTLYTKQFIIQTSKGSPIVYHEDRFIKKLEYNLSQMDNIDCSNITKTTIDKAIQYTFDCTPHFTKIRDVIKFLNIITKSTNTDKFSIYIFDYETNEMELKGDDYSQYVIDMMKHPTGDYSELFNNNIIYYFRMLLDCLLPEYVTKNITLNMLTCIIRYNYKINCKKIFDKVIDNMISNSGGNAYRKFIDGTYNTDTERIVKFIMSYPWMKIKFIGTDGSLESSTELKGRDIQSIKNTINDNEYSESIQKIVFPNRTKKFKINDYQISFVMNGNEYTAVILLDRIYNTETEKIDYVLISFTMNNYDRLEKYIKYQILEKNEPDW